MRRILSVTGALCLLLGGAAWAQTDVGAAKSAPGVVSGSLDYVLKQESPRVVTRMLRGEGASQGDRVSVVIHAEASLAFQTFLDTLGPDHPHCRPVGPTTYYCADLSPSQIDLAVQAGATWVGLAAYREPPPRECDLGGRHGPRDGRSARPIGRRWQRGQCRRDFRWPGQLASVR